MEPVVVPSRRHSNRLKPKPCDKCRQPEPQVVMRTTLAVYVRCARCGHIWPLPKPNSRT